MPAGAPLGASLAGALRRPPDSRKQALCRSLGGNLVAGLCEVFIATFLLEKISIRVSRVLLWYFRLSRLFLIEVYYKWSNAPLMSKEIIRACWLLFFAEFILPRRSRIASSVDLLALKPHWLGC
ncbi:hypothetical protein AVEN_177588-1 [Araneus ventricosus]|uniref:Uncharacterized protein n=1 Tax=Araneus ventricosus TaxID=182803 RepID=A0A4Y2M3F7_ARAVE|nr:hypothetical protein AVEN_177588-1 [Araneus ventricosus]